MVNLPDDLAWSIVKRQNSALRFSNRRNGPVLTSEIGNVMNVPSRKYSGLANSRTVGLESDGNKSILKFKTSKAGSKPRRAFAEVQLRTHGRGTERCVKTVVKSTADRYYRSDLTRAAAARLCRQAKAERRAAAGVTYKPKSRSNK